MAPLRMVTLSQIMLHQDYTMLNTSRGVFCYDKSMNDKSVSEQVDDIIAQYEGWQEQLLKQLRSIIKTAVPEIVEEVKWKMPSNPKGLPVYSYNGIVCIIQTFKNDVKLVFFKGAFLGDPNKLFNARLKSETDRAIEFREGYELNEQGIKELLIEAVAFNSSK